MADYYSSENGKHLRKLRQLKPEMFKGFLDFDAVVFKDGALTGKMKELMAMRAGAAFSHGAIAMNSTETHDPK